MKTFTTSTLALAFALMFTACTKEDIAPQGLQPAPADDFSAQTWSAEPSDNDNEQPVDLDGKDHTGDAVPSYDDPWMDTPDGDQEEDDQTCDQSCQASTPGSHSTLKASAQLEDNDQEQVASSPKDKFERNPDELLDKGMAIDADQR